jgi:hypothetical protein
MDTALHPIEPNDTVAADQRLLDVAPRARGRWSRRCPCCLGTAFRWAAAPELALRHRPTEAALAETPQGTLACAACGAVLGSPARHEDRPAWETAPELVAAWDRYSRRGRLLEEWGRSTDREDRRDHHPPPLDEPEHLAPRVRAPAIRGRQDAQLDAAVRAYVDQTEGLRDAAATLKCLAQELVQAQIEEPRRRPKRSRETDGTPRPIPPAARSLPDPGPDRVDEVVDVDAERFTAQRHDKVLRFEVAVDDAEASPVLAWRAPLFAAVRHALLSQLAALYLLVTNALKARGVEVSGSLDPIHPRTRRSTPFAGLRHALAAAYGLDEPPEASPLPRNAIALHKLPSGVVLGQIACRPSRTYAATAREPSAGGIDVLDAIAAARVGARTYCAPGGRIRREPGRPLHHWERELLRLVDAGEERPHARQNRRTRRIDQLAVERLTPEEALAKIRDMDGAPRTAREAKLAIAAARKAIRLVLQERALIPVAGGAGVDVDEASSPAPPVAPPSKRRPVRTRQSAFAGVGATA